MPTQGMSQRFLAAFKHAFAIPHEEGLAEQERLWLQRLAEEVVRRGLRAPALFLLETARPLNYVGAHVLLFFKPMISLIFPPAQCDRVVDLLLRRECLPVFLEMLEGMERRGDRENGQRRPQGSAGD